jgi:hypothetical protein
MAKSNFLRHQKILARDSKFFRGEMMTCAICGKQKQSDIQVESGWTVMELDSKAHYVCPDELQPDASGDFAPAYEKAMRILIEKNKQ